MTQNDSKKLALAALIMSGSIVASRLLGFLREVVIAAQLGASNQTDAYFAAFSVPDLLKYLLEGGALTIAFVPMFTGYLTRDEEEEGWALFSNITTTIAVMLAVLLTIAWFAAPALVGTFFPGFYGEQVDLTVNLTRIILPQPFFFVLGNLIIATEVAAKRFWAAALAPLVYNASIIVFGLALSPSIGAAGFSWGVLVGSILGPFALPLWMARKRIRFRPRIDLRSPALRRYFMIALPLMIGFSLAVVDEWIGRYFASSFEEGAITWLNNGRRLMQVPTGLIGQAIGYAALPFLAQLAAEKKHEQLRATLGGAAETTLTLALVAAGALALVARPGVDFVFLRGAFTAYDAARTADVLLVLSTSVVGWSLYAVAVRGFYAREDTWTPMLTSSAVALLSIPMYAYFASRWEVLGIATATAIGITVNVIVLLVVYQVRYGGGLWPWLGRGLRSGLVAVVVAGAFGVGVLWAMESVVPSTIGPATRGFFVALASGVVYTAAALGVLVRLGGPAADAVARRLPAPLRRLFGR